MTLLVKQEELARDVLWKPNNGRQTLVRQKKIYFDQLMDDTGCRIEQLLNAMMIQRWMEEKCHGKPTLLDLMKIT